ncbi:cation transporter [Aspergillus avenaceus]|uniref:Potassium transport protein n=1 Tax=Aspergillus avenaceus TaxID=36643 RepID=A0A5N6TGJ6_ASPAV|nr:cation transporter [Aspergillus avenaceus]
MLENYSRTFIVHQYAYIILWGLSGLIILYPCGNLSAVDAYFFGVSASTESGLNPVDMKELKTYQQIYLYFVPILCNMGFINIVVVAVRLYWFEKRMKEAAPTALRPHPDPSLLQKNDRDPEAPPNNTDKDICSGGGSEQRPHEKNTASDEDFDNWKTHEPMSNKYVIVIDGTATESNMRVHRQTNSRALDSDISEACDPNSRRISFVDNDKALYIPPPHERDRGQPIVEVDEGAVQDDISECAEIDDTKSEIRRRPKTRSIPLERVASSMFVLGTHPSKSYGSQLREAISLSKSSELPCVSSQATLGRNSSFYNLTAEDREKLGGIEYRSLKVLLKIVVGYFIGLHIIGAICIVGWIQYAAPKYRTYIAECGQDHIWWAFYSAQTMVSNLGLTLTPDSMISFRDAIFPMLIMSILAYAGNNAYPCLLRLIIWSVSKSVPKNSSLKESLGYLLKYPRRCYTLLFRSRPTWILFGIIFVLNFVDVLLIIVLDLHNPAINTLPGGPRVLAAIFQAASARHTGTASFSLADVSPAVQFSLLVMMYISIFPIAISVRASNTYEERSLGMFSSDEEIDEDDGPKYVVTHMRNQLSFDLWYIFLGIFCICIAETDRLMDSSEPGISVFAIFFEVVSAYGNVGLSLGYPNVSTSLSGQLSIFSKVVICAMMIRGRHRGLPYQLDRAILLPSERLVDDQLDSNSNTLASGRSMDPVDNRQLKVKRCHTK